MTPNELTDLFVSEWPLFHQPYRRKFESQHQSSFHQRDLARGTKTGLFQALLRTGPVDISGAWV